MHCSVCLTEIQGDLPADCAALCAQCTPIVKRIMHEHFTLKDPDWNPVALRWIAGHLCQRS